ncbi:hypothetical protein BBJ28_00024768, partial [Nothophytophthora sp. Chile5]
SGERFRVARRTCAKSGKAALFRCLEAPRFVNFHVQAHEAVQQALVPGFTLPNARSDRELKTGIIMVVYPKVVASAFATIRVLRNVLDCRLPIEIWFRPDEMRKVTAAIEPLQQLAQNDSIGLTFHEIDDPLAIEFAAKVHAIYHSFFDRVLFLDSDNVPVRDPSFLFETSEFVETGAVFWPDLWHPDHTTFFLHGDSLLWELLDLPFVDMFEQESGQLLIDRRRHAVSLELVHFFTFHRPNLFSQLKLVWGDKDLFRLAWLKLKTPFHMIATPPAMAGKFVNQTFCGMTMVQHDAQGNVLFLHRNSLKLTGGGTHKPVNPKLEAMRRERKNRLRDNGSPEGEETPAGTLEADGYPDPVIWTHLLSFRNTSRRSDYKIETYHVVLKSPKEQVCYGQRSLDSNQHFYTQEIAELSFAGLETELRRFATEATQLHQNRLDAQAAAQQPGK